MYKGLPNVINRIYLKIKITDLHKFLIDFSKLGYRERSINAVKKLKNI